jgi:hypothetical protein
MKELMTKELEKDDRFATALEHNSLRKNAFLIMVTTCCIMIEEITGSSMGYTIRYKSNIYDLSREPSQNGTLSLSYKSRSLSSNFRILIFPLLRRVQFQSIGCEVIRRTAHLLLRLFFARLAAAVCRLARRSEDAASFIGFRSAPISPRSNRSCSLG